MISDNSAARLLLILENSKKLSPNMICQDAWMNIFQLSRTDPNSQSLLMSKLGQVMLLPHETKLLVDEHYPSQSSALAHTLNQVQTSFKYLSLKDKWELFTRHIDTHCIDALSMTVALLDYKLDSKIIDNEQLVSFRERVQLLINEVVDSELSSEFKKFMVHYLQKILSSINDYLISGAMPILSAVEAAIGHAVLDPKFKEELKNTETGLKVRETLGDLANVITIATASTGAIAYIASHGLKMLG